MKIDKARVYRGIRTLFAVLFGIGIFWVLYDQSTRIVTQRFGQLPRWKHALIPFAFTALWCLGTDWRRLIVRVLSLVLIVTIVPFWAMNAGLNWLIVDWLGFKTVPPLWLGFLGVALAIWIASLPPLELFSKKRWFVKKSLMAYVIRNDFSAIPSGRMYAVAGPGIYFMFPWEQRVKEFPLEERTPLGEDAIEFQTKKGYFFKMDWNVFGISDKEVLADFLVRYGGNWDKAKKRLKQSVIPWLEEEFAKVDQDLNEIDDLIEAIYAVANRFQRELFDDSCRVELEAEIGVKLFGGLVTNFDPGEEMRRFISARLNAKRWEEVVARVNGTVPEAQVGPVTLGMLGIEGTPVQVHQVTIGGDPRLIAALRAMGINI